MDVIVKTLQSEREARERFEKWLFTQIDQSGIQLDALVQRSPGWHNARKSKLTASRFGVIAEVSRYADAHALWEVMVGQIIAEIVDNNHVRRGQVEESVAIRAYEQITATRVEATGLFLAAEPLSYLGASPDGLLADGKGLLEIKSPANATGWTNQSISDEYMAQVQGQLAICNREYCDFCMWHKSSGLQIYRVYRSHEYW